MGKREFDSSYHKREKHAVGAIIREIPDSLRDRVVHSGFVDLIESSVHNNHYMTSAVDGIGTKIILAIASETYNKIGIDLVAMVANDTATMGNVRSLVFMNDISCQYKIEEEIAGQIMKGIVEGCKRADAKIHKKGSGINIGKGETASLDSLLASPRGGYGFNVTASMVGFLSKDDFSRKFVEPGFVILGFYSTGCHSNGYTDLREKLLCGDFEERPKERDRYIGKHSLDDKVPGTNKTIKEILLKPTAIYSREMRKIGNQFPYAFGVNITGYGLRNFNRIGEGLEYHINNPFDPQSIFRFYQEETGEPDKIMYEKFNMGLGFAVLAKKRDVRRIAKIVSKNEIIKVIGEVKKSKSGGNRTILDKDGKEIIFEGYQ